MPVPSLLASHRQTVDCEHLNPRISVPLVHKSKQHGCPVTGSNVHDATVSWSRRALVRRVRRVRSVRSDCWQPAFIGTDSQQPTSLRPRCWVGAPRRRGQWRAARGSLTRSAGSGLVRSGVPARMAERQTRRPQKPLSERACGFESRSGHPPAMWPVHAGPHPGSRHAKVAGVTRNSQIAAFSSPGRMFVTSGAGGSEGDQQD